MTLQFECLRDAMMLEAAGGMSSHTLTHIAGFSPRSCTERLHASVLRRFSLTWAQKTSPLITNNHNNKKLCMFVILGGILFSAPSFCVLCFFLFFVFYQSASERSEMAASRHLLSLQFWNKHCFIYLFFFFFAFSPNTGDLGVCSLL